MFKNIGEDIPKRNIDYTYLSLVSSKTIIGIIGGGKVGYIKSKNFIAKGCNVEVLSLDFIEEFYNIENVKLIKGSYYKDFICDKHIVIISTNDSFTRN